MGKTHIAIYDPHAHYRHNNNRAVWISKLIEEVRPDVVINGGDTWDMPSLAGYDKGKKCFQGRTYMQDIDAGCDFNEKLWHYPRKRKKTLPERFFLVGNHEQRIDRAIQMQPELEGAIGYHHLDLERHYDYIIPYTGGTPGYIEVDGVVYAHYFASGIMGRNIGGEHPAYTHINKLHCSSTSGHTHLLDYTVRSGVGGRFMGLVAGCAFDYVTDWAGVELNNMYWRGVVIKRNVENGWYDPEFLSLESLRMRYGFLTGD